MGTVLIHAPLKVAHTHQQLFEGCLVARHTSEVEFHITTGLAIMMMIFDALSPVFELGLVNAKCTAFKKVQHERSPDVTEICDDFQSWFPDNLR